MALINLGADAPSFTLKNQNNKDIKLEDFRGKKVLLSFHPLAFTGVCIDQMRQLERRYQEFEEKGVVPLGISVDPTPAKSVWAKSLMLEKLDILSDFHPLGEVARAYGLFLSDKGISGRANVLIDETGKVYWTKQYDIPELPDFDEVLDQV
ncbi:MAG: redoxin domain-containing protein [Tissierellia bacterium]|nr:redoxin domain-containing protein [Tissierellia bacterium]